MKTFPGGLTVVNTPPAIPEPPILHPNQIDAIYVQMRNSGQSYVGQIGTHPISIEEWRRRELERAASVNQ